MKQQLRKEFLNLRKSLNPATLNPGLNSNLLDFLKFNATNLTIGGYHPLNSEADITSTLKNLMANSTIGLPCIKFNTLEFYQYNNLTKLILNKFKVMEPTKSELIVPQLVLIPLIAVDLQGNRLGYGKGYYDRYLASSEASIIKVGICYEIQIAEKIPAEPHDIPLNYIITEKNIYKCKNT